MGAHIQSAPGREDEQVQRYPHTGRHTERFSEGESHQDHLGRVPKPDRETGGSPSVQGALHRHGPI